jgi:hypothetical protein
VKRFQVLTAVADNAIPLHLTAAEYLWDAGFTVRGRAMVYIDSQQRGHMESKVIVVQIYIQENYEPLETHFCHSARWNEIIAADRKSESVDDR